MKVALVVGHNEAAQGAIGSLGISEYHFNKMLASDIKKHNYTDNTISVYIRPPLRSYRKQIDAVNSAMSNIYDLVVEMHFNSANDIDINGHEVLYCSNSKKSKDIAKIFDTQFDLLLTNRDRNIKPRNSNQRGGYFLCSGIEPRILVEPFFASHQHLYQRGSEDYSRLLGAMLIGIDNACEYLKYEKLH